MGWQAEDANHPEGWDAAEFPGGLFSVGGGTTTAGVSGVLVRYLRRELDTADEPLVVDGRTAIGWRGVCECGWRGPLWERVTDPMEHDPRARKLFVPDPGVFADTPAGIEDLIYREWAGHLPSRALADVRDAGYDVRKAQQRLDEAVQRARAEGVSWADIGEAAGMTRQSAHERWSRR